jgi:DNA-binding transcriptional ArsR family regulator
MTNTQHKEASPIKHLYRTNDPDTSVLAACSIDVTRLEYVVLDAIKKLGPCISDEVREQFPNLSYSSVTARYRALLDRGLIKDTGKRRKGNSGRNQRVMEAIDK